jgi:hypothetical protein
VRGEKLNLSLMTFHLSLIPNRKMLKTDTFIYAHSSIKIKNIIRVLSCNSWLTFFFKLCNLAHFRADQIVRKSLPH